MQNIFKNNSLPATNMADGDAQNLPKHMTYSKCNVPFIGALVDYVETSLEYVIKRNFARAEKLHAKSSRSTLSASYLAFVCLMLGFTCNVKFEVVTFNEEPLPSDLHFMLMSNEDKLYIDDIDVSKVMLCIEASDLLILVISCLLIWNSSYAKSPISEYLFLPWLGLCLRGLFLRQGPTVGALIYTMLIVNGYIDPLFLTAFTFLYFLEARVWLEIARAVRSRWEARNHMIAQDARYEVETLWSNEDVHSIEVHNYIY